jgi:hypothetical protein
MFHKMVPITEYVDYKLIDDAPCYKIVRFRTVFVRF